MPTHTPRVEQSKRVHIEPVGSTFLRVLLRFGYMETPNIPKALGVARCARAGPAGASG